MQYTSISKLFDYCGITVSETVPLPLSRIKKQIAAEFAMTKDGILVIGEASYNKQDVLQVLDSPNVNELIRFHFLIDSYPALYDFLTTGILRGGLLEAKDELKNYLDLVAYISPYYAPRYNREMKARLEKPDFERAEEWIGYYSLILINDGEIAFQSTAAFLDASLRKFKNLNKQTFLEKRESLRPWTQNWATFLNRLPDLLYAQKEELAIQLINFTVEIQDVDQEFCYLLSAQMVGLDYLDESNIQLIRSNHEIYESRVAHTKLVPKSVNKKYRKGKNGDFKWIIYVIIAVFFLTRLVKSCNSDIGSRKDEINTTEVVVDALFEKDIQFGRSLTPDKDTKSAFGLGSDSSLVTYLCFLAAGNDDSTSYCLINKTNKVLDLIVPMADEPLILTLGENDSLTLRRRGVNLDFLVALRPPSTKESSAASVEWYESYNSNSWVATSDVFYFSKKSVKSFNSAFSDRIVLELEPASKIVPKYLILERSKGKLYFTSNDLKLAKSMLTKDNVVEKINFYKSLSK